MALKKWKKLSEEKLTENPWWSYILAKFEFKKGKIAEFHFIRSLDSVGIVAVDKDEKIPMVKQYRCLFDKFSLEIPMGGVEQGQTPEEAAHIELAEEAQLKARHVELVGEYNCNNARIQQRDYVFVAYGLSDTVAEVDETEEFERYRYSVDEVEDLIDSGEISAGMTITSWRLAKPRVLEIIKQGLHKAKD